MQLSPISLAITRLGGVRFSPSALFSSGEQGAWYDPSDLTTLFQDSAGTTPVTAVEQPVGLVLDKSKGLVLGPELVTNGDFSGGTTGWTAYASTLSVSGGEVTVTNSGVNYGEIYQTVTTVVGQMYRISATLRVGTAATVNLRAETVLTAANLFQQTTSSASNVVISGYFVATGTSTIVGCANANTNNGTGIFDNISVKSIAGNHAYQTTSASRPTLRARYNLLTYSEDYSNAVWVKSNLTRTTGVSDPFGGTSATTLTASGGSGRIYIAVPVVANANYTGSFYIRRRTGTGDINWEAFTVGVGALITTTGSWTRVTVTANTPATTAYFGIRIATTGDEIDVFAADFRPGSSAGTYQRIAAATDYATGADFPVGLDADGVDDGLLTNSVDFSATDKMTVWAGVTKSSDAAVGILAELSSDFNGNAGSFNVAPNSNAAAAAPNYAAASRGSAAPSVGQYAVSATVTAPITNVSTSQFNISGNLSALRINGSASGTNGTNSQGTGNFGNYPLYIGRRGNATLPLNGRIYSLIIRGAQSTAAQISSTESWVAAKTPLGSL